MPSAAYADSEPRPRRAGSGASGSKTVEGTFGGAEAASIGSRLCNQTTSESAALIRSNLLS